LVKPLSIEDAYFWAQRFVVREWRLALPVVFAFLALPQLMLDLLIPGSTRAQLALALQANNLAAMMTVMRWLFPVTLIVLLIGAVGGLAICALALQPGISVREALVLAVRRLGVFIGSQLLLAGGAVLVMIAVLVLVRFGQLKPAGAQSLLLGIMLGLALFVGVRLVPLMPLIVRRRVGPVSALRESWMMTAGAFWRIFGAIAIYLIGTIVVMVALSTGVGALLLLIGKMVGQPELGLVLDMVFQRAVAAVAAAGAYLLVVAIFRQLDGSMRGT
jgi:hypothetical protein